MRILHINSEYASNNLYKNLVKELYRHDIEQIIYASIKDISLFGINYIELNDVSFYYSQPLKFYHRLLYFQKINFLLNDLLDKIDVNEVNLIHAHKLFSDGGIAYKLYKKYKIPYIINIRNTDINFFYRYMPWLKPYALEILNNAQSIVLLSYSYDNKLKTIHYNSYNFLRKKITVIPNGIDRVWINNVKISNRLVHVKGNAFELVYSGNFSKGKRVVLLVKLICQLRDMGYKINLTLIGGGGTDHDKVLSLIKDISYISFLGYMSFQKMIDIYKNMHAFIMISKHETFGLAYIEALSQNLPIIYTRGEAMDSFFEEGEVGYPVNPNNINEVIKAFDSIKKRYITIAKNCTIVSKEFNWPDISSKYVDLYKKVI